MTGKLLYSLVARGTVVLAEHSNTSGNANIIAVRILEKLQAEDGRVSYTQDQHMFHILVENGITFLVMAEQVFGRRIPFAYLDDMKTRFFSHYGQSCMEGVAYEYNTEFSRVLAERMHYFANDPKADSINRVTASIAEVKNIMIENIDKVLERGEKLDLLVDKTDNLSNDAFTFYRTARQMQNKLWWQSARLWFLIGGGIVIIVYLIVSLACGFTFSKC